MRAGAWSRSRLLVVGVWLAGVVVIGLLVIHVAGSGPTSTTSVADPIGKIHAIAPDHRVAAATLTGPLLGGGTYDAAAFAGRIEVVNAWGSWCEPCKAELPILRRLASASYPAPVQFLGLDVEEDSMAAGEAMAKRYAIPYPSIFDADKTVYGALAPTMSFTGVPGTVVIDAKGRVAATVIGPVDETAMAKYLRQLAAEPF
jgi:thiol-disulfide isomerase/thioredoxin